MVLKKELPACPVATTIGLISSKWKVLILRDVLTAPSRFGELRRSLDGISQKVLTESLRSMEEDGLLVRNEAYAGKVLQVEYALSELGERMRPIIEAMADFGDWYKEQVQQAN